MPTTRKPRQSRDRQPAAVDRLAPRLGQTTGQATWSILAIFKKTNETIAHVAIIDGVVPDDYGNFFSGVTVGGIRIDSIDPSQAPLIQFDLQEEPPNNTWINETTLTNQDGLQRPCKATSGEATWQIEEL